MYHLRHGHPPATIRTMLFGLVLALLLFAFVALVPGRIAAASILTALCWILSRILP